MASVSSLDKDLKSLRLEKYTPQRETETREWIESVLNERLGSTDLLEALKDGVALCKLVNAVAGPGTIKIKQSSMPFVQMEQISHFLRACQASPLLIPQHDCFQTVDLYERKDPAQVLQCIGAFSRKAAALQPAIFPSGIGGMKASTLSPQASGSGAQTAASPTASGRMPSGKDFTASPPGSSTWAKKNDVHNTAPAWNIAQYGWTGGASQGNQGVAFGARRQLVSAQPQVPSLAEKERRRREQAFEAERQAKQAEEERTKRQAQTEEEERLAAENEAHQWEEQTRRQREKQRQEAEDEKKRWEAEERRWKEEEEQRLREEREAEERLRRDHTTKPKLQGQYLSQYQSAQKQSARAISESDRIKELERQLAEAREREQKYQEDRLKGQTTGSSQKSASAVPPDPPAKHTSTDFFDTDVDGQSERSLLKQQWKQSQNTPAQSQDKEQDAQAPRPLPMPGSQVSQNASPRPLPVPGKKPTFPNSQATAANTAPLEPPKSPRPLPNPTMALSPHPSDTPGAPKFPRPLPDPSTYVPPSQPVNRTDAFLATNPAPMSTAARSFMPSEAAFSSSAEQANEDARRVASQQKTKAGGFAAKSLIEREMERERERQREWEESMAATKAAAEKGNLDASAGSAPGQGFNTTQYGFLGGDNLNKGGGGVYSGRRQIIGPRAMGNKPT